MANDQPFNSSGDDRDRGDDAVIRLLRRATGSNVVPPLLLMLDFDGTLVDIAPTPDAIVVPDDATAVLRALVALRHRIWIVSGRTRAFLTGRLALAVDDEIGVVGLHGADWPGDDAPAADPRLVQARQAVLEALGSRGPAVLIEDKGLSVAFHTRSLLDAADHDHVVGVIADVVATFAGDGLSVLRGHEVIELRPANANKGRAAARLMAAHASLLPVFVGDDVTDEDAFAAVGDRGVSVRVSVDADVSTAANVVVASPAVVWSVLRRLTTLAAPGPSAP